MITLQQQLQIEKIVADVLSDKGRTKPLIVEHIDLTQSGRAAVSVQTEAGVNTLAKWFQRAGAKDVSIMSNAVDSRAVVEFALETEEVHDGV